MNGRTSISPWESGWRQHGGKWVYYGNYTGFGVDAQGLALEIESIDAELVRQPDDSVLALADVRGTTGTTEVVRLFKLSATRTRRCTHKQAVVGIAGLKRVLAQAIANVSNQPMKLFDSVEEAMDWLVADDDEIGIGQPVMPVRLSETD